MPNEQIVLYTNPMSRGRIARWMLEETGQPYRAEVLEYGAAMKSPQYLAINPMGKVPAIVHGGYGRPAGAARNALGPEVLAAPRADDDVGSAGDDFQRIGEDAVAGER